MSYLFFSDHIQYARSISLLQNIEIWYLSWKILGYKYRSSRLGQWHIRKICYTHSWKPLLESISIWIAYRENSTQARFTIKPVIWFSIYSCLVGMRNLISVVFACRMIATRTLAKRWVYQSYELKLLHYNICEFQGTDLLAPHFDLIVKFP